MKSSVVDEPVSLRERFLFKCGQFKLELGGRTHLMGILNLTPDSFSGDGIYNEVDRAVDHAQRMADEGADIVDVGGESTRPGARGVLAEEEISRVIPVLKRLKNLKIPISIDTSKSEVLQQALDLGASIVNDISGLRFDPNLAKLAAIYGAGVVLMHMKGCPRTMQQDPIYGSLIPEIIAGLGRSIEIAKEAGIDDGRILIDPGIGFGKTKSHNLKILRQLGEFRSLGQPILVGTSRKSVIGAVLELPVDQRGWGTAATVAVAICGGAHVVRVHDVKEMSQVAKMVDAIFYH